MSVFEKLETADYASRQSAALLASVATNARDAILITEAQPIDGIGPRILYANPAFCAMTGYAIEEIIGKTPRILQGPKTNRAELDRLKKALVAWQAIRVELVNYTKAGVAFDVEIDIVPVEDGTGLYTHWLAIQRDVTDRRKWESERLRNLLEEIPHLVWRSCDLGNWTWASPQWLSFTGQTQAESHGKGWLAVVHADDHADADAAWEQAQLDGFLDVEFRVRRDADGAFIWHHTRALPIRDYRGRIEEWIGTTTNIQQLKEAQQHQQLLLRELQHRTRNQLAVVQSIIQKTLDRSQSLGEFRASYAGRLSALSRVQGLLSRGDRETLDLRQLVDAELLAHGYETLQIASIEGPSVTLTGSAVQALPLALHELATNSLKYGALGQASGSLSVSWRIDGDTVSPRLLLDWSERGVTMPDENARRPTGFGMELIRRALPYQLGATTELTFGCDGITCLISMPLAGPN